MKRNSLKTLTCMQKDPASSRYPELGPCTNKVQVDERATAVLCPSCTAKLINFKY